MTVIDSVWLRWYGMRGTTNLGLKRGVSISRQRIERGGLSRCGEAHAPSLLIRCKVRRRHAQNAAQRYHPLCTFKVVRKPWPLQCSHTRRCSSLQLPALPLFLKLTASRCGHRASSLFARLLPRQHEVFSILSCRVQDSRLSAAGQRACCLEAVSCKINACVST